MIPLLIPVLGWVATILFTICYLPQIYRMIKLRRVDGVSFWFLFIPLLANIDALAYAVLLGQWPLIVKYIAGIIVCTICLLVFRIFK